MGKGRKRLRMQTVPCPLLPSMRSGFFGEWWVLIIIFNRSLKKRRIRTGENNVSKDKLRKSRTYGTENQWGYNNEQRDGN